MEITIPAPQTTTTNELVQLLLPPIPMLKIENITRGENHLTLQLTTTVPTATCPACGILSSRVHKYYQRKVNDLAWGQYQVRLELQVRCFYCRNAECAKATFAERLDPNLAAYARRTARLETFLAQLALKSGGNGGAKLALSVQLKVSPSTLLRVIGRLPLPAFEPPRVVGVDDFAFLKGQNYGTIVLDLEKHQTLTLLEDREAETLSSWLREQQKRAQKAGNSIEIVSRDRNSAYAKAVRDALPEAVQVADRFHLKQSLRQAVQKVVRRFYPDLKPLLEQLYTENNQPEVTSALNEAPAAVNPAELQPSPPIVREGFSRLVASQATPATSLSEQTEVKLSYWDKQKAISQKNREALYEQVQKLVEQGIKSSEIARRLSISPKVARRLAALKTPPSPPIYKKRRHQLDPHKEHLHKRFFEEGYDNALGLGRELRERGYTGSQGVVSAYVTKLRVLKGGIELGGNPRVNTPLRPVQTVKLPSVYEISWWVMLDEAKLDQRINKLAGLCEKQVEIAKAYQLVQEFNLMMTERKAEDLNKWLEQMCESGIAELVSLGQGMRQDEEAIRAGLTLEWSQGVAEGTINKLKVLKREMYGRGSLQLLTKRLILAA